MTRALVTGASSGIGAALARTLAARGVEVWLAARREAELERQVAAIRSAGGRAHALVLDVADADAVFARLAQLDEETGGIDLVVANAGIAGSRSAIPVSRVAWEDVRDVLQVNLIGAAATLMPFVPGMIRRGRGQLVGISSLAADIPNPRTAPYGASKAGLTYFLEALDLELRPLGIAVTSVHPGFVRTDAVEQLDDELPLVLEVEAAIAIIDRAIVAKKRLVRFPWILGALFRIIRALPRAWTAPLIRRFSSKRAGV